MLWRGVRLTDAALFAVVAGGALRVWAWQANWPLWLDEQAIAIVLRDRGYRDLIGSLPNNTSAPIGWLWLQRLVIDIAGTGERALRVVPLLFGVGTVVAAWLVGRRFLGLAGTMALTGLCAVNIGFVAYSTQVKHYAGDTFFALVLVGLAWWIVESPTTLRRWVVFWSVAAVGSLLSMGAFLVVPGLAVVLLVVAWRAGTMRGWLLGLVWLVAFGANYLLALRATAVGNAYLDRVWAHGYPPSGTGPAGVVVWVGKRLALLAEDPLHLGAGIGGRPWPFVIGIPFWLLVLLGIVVAYRRRPALGLLLAAPIASAFLYGITRQVPLLARLALWVVPVIFMAVAVAVDAVVPAGWPAARVGPAGPQGDRLRVAAVALARRRTWWSLAGGLVVLVLLVPAGHASIARAGGRPDHDDRAGVEFLRSRHRPGDLTLVVGFSGRALEWYDPDRTLQPAATVLSVPSSAAACDRDALRRAVAGHPRVLAYGGARIPPYGATVDVLRDELARLGTIVETRRLTGTSVVYIVDVAPPPATVLVLPDADCLIFR